MYPSLLVPNAKEKLFINNGQEVQIPKKELVFQKWKGEKLNNTFGNKPLIDFDGVPVFAEIAILKLGLISSWKGRWIETYGMKGNNPYYLSDWVDDKLGKQKSSEIESDKVKSVIEQIAQENNGYSGTWDIILWKDDEFVFYECKRKNKDSLRGSQLNWIESALKCGLNLKNFVILEWGF